jgi:hypothetical protein
MRSLEVITARIFCVSPTLFEIVQRGARVATDLYARKLSACAAKKPILNSQVSLAGLVANAIYGFEASYDEVLCEKCLPGEKSSLILPTINRQALDPDVNRTTAKGLTATGECYRPGL